MRFYLTPPGGFGPTLVVETRAVVDDAAIAELRADLYGLSCPNGILFDENRCVILRDTFESMEESSIKVEGELATKDVLGHLAVNERRTRSLDERVQDWLEILSTNWDQALPLEPAVVEKFLTDIVPAASGSDVRALVRAAS